MQARPTQAATHPARRLRHRRSCPRSRRAGSDRASSILVTEAELAREKRTETRSGPSAAGDGAPATEEASDTAPEKDAGADADTGVAGAPEDRAGGVVPAEEPAIEPDAAGAVPPPGPPAEGDTAGPPEPAAAPEDPEPAGGLMRF